MTDFLPPVRPSDQRRRAASDAVAQARVLGTPQAVASAAGEWSQSKVLGLDTEFVRERTFFARPGLVQVSDGEQVWLLDPVACSRMPDLGHMLADAGVTKVLHSVGEDLDVLHAVGGTWPAPLFDTQVAAALLGLPLQCRYETLVEMAFGVELAGGKARNDWCRRPLSSGLLRYAAEDVVWLPDLQRRLESLLDEAGRLEWLREDCDRLVDRARTGDDTPPLARVKGAGRLAESELAVLDALARWRDRAAREHDLPRRFVLSDETLVEMAQASTEDGQDKALGPLKDGQKRRYGEAIRAEIAAADASSFSRPEWLDPLTPEERSRLKTAQRRVREIAEELGIDPAVIASKKALTHLIRGQQPDWLSGWRGRILAGQLEEASVSIPAPRN